MITLTIDGYKPLLEAQLLLALRLAFKRRTVVADLAALAALPVEAVADGDLAFVTAETRVYLYDRFSGAAAGPGVVVPAALPTRHPGARWLAATLPATYGPDWRRLLQAQPTGLLREIELYTGDGGEDDRLERVYAATPSLLIEASGDSPSPLSCGRPGSYYRIDVSYTITVICENLRASPSSSWGSPASTGETDPPPARVIGLLRKVFAGLGEAELDLQGLDRLEIGDSRLVQEDLGERLLAWEAELRAILYLHIPDEDLEPLLIDSQPLLADSPPGARFDPANYVASGYEVTPGPTLTATPSPGLALIAGSPVTSTPPAHTFGPGKDTYRDLAADGSISYSAVDPGHPAPAQAAGTLRLAVTATDATGITGDRWLCSYSQAWGPVRQVAP